MADSYVGEIRMFGGNFAPAGWMFCDGALIPIAQNDVLFQLIGTTYGGDGVNTFAVPDLRGRLPIHTGQGAGMSVRTLGESGGAEEVTLNVQQMPVHSHTMAASNDIAALPTPQGNVTGQAAAKLYRAGVPTVQMDPQSLAPAGGSQPHENVQPFLCVNFIISLFGIFPSP
jgi:microcystin-dependent protein